MSVVITEYMCMKTKEVRFIDLILVHYKIEKVYKEGGEQGFNFFVVGWVTSSRLKSRFIWFMTECKCTLKVALL